MLPHLNIIIKIVLLHLMLQEIRNNGWYPKITGWRKRSRNIEFLSISIIFNSLHMIMKKMFPFEGVPEELCFFNYVTNHVEALWLLNHVLNHVEELWPFNHVVIMSKSCASSTLDVYWAVLMLSPFHIDSDHVKFAQVIFVSKFLPWENRLEKCQ